MARLKQVCQLPGIARARNDDVPETRPRPPLVMRAKRTLKRPVSGAARVGPTNRGRCNRQTETLRPSAAASFSEFGSCCGWLALFLLMSIWCREALTTIDSATSVRMGAGEGG